MTSTRLARLLAGVMCTAVLSTAVTAQTPVPKTVPKMTLPWLQGLTIAPTSVTVSSSTTAEISATVLLLRPAVAPMTVYFSLSGARVDESGAMIADNVLAPNRLIIPAGSNSATARISVAQAPAGPSKTYTLTATYGTETKSGTFTVNRR